MSFVIFVGLSLVACSFHALVLYSFRHIVMLFGLVIPLTVVLFLPIVFFLVVPSLLGRLRSR
jgi:lipopolysaccharide export LptBFGC system permease protein LptF